MTSKRNGWEDGLEFEVVCRLPSDSGIARLWHTLQEVAFCSRSMYVAVPPISRLSELPIIATVLYWSDRSQMTENLDTANFTIHELLVEYIR